MKTSFQSGVSRRTLLAGALATSSVALVGCGGPGGSDSGGKGSQEAVDAALKKGGTITYWTWTPSGPPQAKAFMKEYPKVTVKVVNVGTGDAHYTKLLNAIKAGSGGPDVAQIEYHALPQYAVPGHLVDLRQYGFGAFEDDYLDSAWESARGLSDGMAALPQGGGPMVLHYNKAVFDKHGIAVPKTWDEYVKAARKLHKADPKKYITSDTGDPGFIMAMIWQAGGRPFQVKGDQITINFGDEGTRRFTSAWNPLLKDGLISDIQGWTDEWYRAMGDGTIATIPAGSWMADIIRDNAPDAAGDWRVAPMPTYDGGSPVSSEHGGSHQAVLKQSKNPALAAGFLRWLNHEQGNQIYVEEGGLPATLKDLESPDFLNQEWEYFGGQKVNKIIVESAKVVGEGWQFLPYQTYANSVAGDTLGKVYKTRGDINAGLKAWQDTLVAYGNKQGFKVNG